MCNHQANSFSKIRRKTNDSFDKYVCDCRSAVVDWTPLSVIKVTVIFFLWAIYNGTYNYLWIIYLNTKIQNKIQWKIHNKQIKIYRHEYTQMKANKQSLFDCYYQSSSSKLRLNNNNKKKII